MTKVIHPFLLQEMSAHVPNNDGIHSHAAVLQAATAHKTASGSLMRTARVF
ncbi:hypothetical protein [Rhodoferax lacus]|uniref:hypothetical protein n=1 Tax=Rhodoferax lacus TaxID=2184758 RepID=UPI0013143AED|nr:hypothetical protein [Rhodoferax lacus]